MKIFRFGYDNGKTTEWIGNVKAKDMEGAFKLLNGQLRVQEGLMHPVAITVKKAAHEHPNQQRS